MVAPAAGRSGALANWKVNCRLDDSGASRNGRRVSPMLGARQLEQWDLDRRGRMQSRHLTTKGTWAPTGRIGPRLGTSRLLRA